MPRDASRDNLIAAVRVWTMGAVNARAVIADPGSDGRELATGPRMKRRYPAEALVFDIIDPHLLTFEDAWHRAKGLAKYAAKHADAFGRIEMTRVDDGRIDRLNLMDEVQRDRVLRVSTNDHLRELFDSR